MVLSGSTLGRYFLRSSSNAITSGSFSKRGTPTSFIADRDDAGGVLEAGGGENRAAGRARRQQMQRLPAELGDFADRLRRCFAGRDIVENVGAGFREIDEL